VALLSLLLTPISRSSLGYEHHALSDELTGLFGRRVDLVSLRSLHPMLKASVLAEARPVYAA
jgi:uncharacterized protein